MKITVNYAFSSYSLTSPDILQLSPRAGVELLKLED
jgi:hypothetical protein